MIFIISLAAGATVLVASLALSGHTDHGHETHGHDCSNAHGTHHGGHAENHPSSPSIFNIRFLSACATGFGAGGLGAQVLGYSFWASTLIGAATAGVLVYALYRIARVLYRQQASSLVSRDDLFAASGVVTIGIPAGGAGEVEIAAKGTTRHFIARSMGGKPIPERTAVTVEDITPDHLLVAVDQRNHLV